MSDTDNHTHVMCSTCDKPMIYKPTLEELPGGIEKTSVTCPHCHTVTTVWISDPDVRRYMAVQRNTRNMGEKRRLAKLISGKVGALMKEGF